MPLSRPRRRRYMNLTPLIDIVFLLLVFFMLASTFLKFGTVKLETVGAGNAAAVDISKVALVHVGADGSFRVAGVPVAADGLARTLERSLADGKTDVIVVLRKEATVSDLINGLTRIRQLGFSSVRVVD